VILLRVLHSMVVTDDLNVRRGATRDIAVLATLAVDESVCEAKGHCIFASNEHNLDSPRRF